MKLKHKLTIVFVPLLFSMASCNNSKKLHPAEKSYSGLRDYSRLDTQNASNYLNLLFTNINNSNDTVVQRSSKQSNQLGLLLKIAERQIDTTEACTTSGEIKTTGEINDNVGQTIIE